MPRQITTEAVEKSMHVCSVNEEDGGSLKDANANCTTALNAADAGHRLTDMMDIRSHFTEKNYHTDVKAVDRSVKL